jgi:hypothetical protein
VLHTNYCRAAFRLVCNELGRLQVDKAMDRPAAQVDAAWLQLAFSRMHQPRQSDQRQRLATAPPRSRNYRFVAKQGPITDGCCVALPARV